VVAFRSVLFEEPQTTMNELITIRRVERDEVMNCIEGLSDVLIDCVEGGASVSFMLPLPRQVALDFWHGVAQGVLRHERILLVAHTADGQIVGTVQLITALPDNQPHRADVAKMLVSRRVRKQGVGARLMDEVDRVARAAGKTVLVLDTVTGGDAQRLYERAGWQRVGDVPNYALMPDGTLCGTTFFHKQLLA
jgi:GNAT superfamily N-acetyltransferase